jgi:hypothetical protein
VDESGVFSSQYHSTMVLQAHISPGGMNNRDVGGNGSET